MKVECFGFPSLSLFVASLTGDVRKEQLRCVTASKASGVGREGGTSQTFGSWRSADLLLMINQRANTPASVLFLLSSNDGLSAFFFSTFILV